MTHRDRFDWSDLDQVDLLINASQAFPKLEKLVFEAKSEILLAFRVFDGETQLRSEHKTHDMRTWADLVAHKVEQGVTVRLLLADFEPILTPKLHQKSWTSVGKFLEKSQNAGRFEVICAQHSAQFAPMPRAIFWPWFVKKLWDMRQTIRSGSLDLRNTPGLRPYFTSDAHIKLRALTKPTEMRPVTYHQKLAIIDSDKAIVGGLDVDERRYDTAAHDQSAEDTWHDLSVCVEGSAANDLKAHFASCWNDEIGQTDHFKKLERFCTANGLIKPSVNAMTLSNTVHPVSHTAHKARVIRTLSQHAKGLFTIQPKNTHDEILQETLDIIAACKRSVYIETQFFRSQDLAQALARQAARQKDLTLILLLPFAPEEVAFDKHHHPAHRHGEWLQGKCLKVLRRAFGERLGLFSLAKPEAASGETGRAKEYGAGVIHIHSKLLIADDERLTISSANLNGRSLKWDTEVGLSFDDPGFALSCKNRLWKQHLGAEDTPPWGPDNGLSFWKETAFANVKRAPQERQGFVLPHRSSKTIRYGRPSVFIPDEMV